MKEALICFLIAIVIGSLFNSLRGFDLWGTAQTPGTPANAVTSITENTFDENVVNSQQPVLVDFYSDNSDDSKAMVPFVADLANQMKSSIKVVRIDADENPIMTKNYEVTVLPDVLFFKNGAKVDSLSGKVTEDELFKFVNRCNKEGGATATRDNQAQPGQTKE